MHFRAWDWVNFHHGADTAPIAGNACRADRTAACGLSFVLVRLPVYGYGRDFRAIVQPIAETIGFFGILYLTAVNPLRVANV